MAEGTELTCTVPTYQAPENVDDPEHTDPQVPILVKGRSTGLDIVLGSDTDDVIAHPDEGVAGLFIERRKHGWVVVVNGIYGGDADGYLSICDDGRVYLINETAIFGGHMIEVIGHVHRGNPADLTPEEWEDTRQ